jgi:hypothetical protein
MAQALREIKFRKFDHASGGSLIGHGMWQAAVFQWNRGQLTVKVTADPANGRCRQVSGDP